MRPQTTIKQTLSRLSANHDADPVRAARQLQAIDIPAIEADDIATFGWLTNHVIGERLKQWKVALDMHRQLVARDDAPAAAFRHLAVAANLSGDLLDAWRAEADLAKLHGVPLAEATLAVRLATLQHAASSMEAEAVAHLLDLTCDQWRSLPRANVFARVYASALNNTVSEWINRPKPEPSPAVRASMLAAAEVCREIWLQAGTWTNHERADYLLAVVANVIGNHKLAQAAAERGIAVIEANGPEDVDRAFLLLEKARALRAQGRAAGYEAARTQAFKLAESFDDEALTTWFQDKAAGL